MPARLRETAFDGAVVAASALLFVSYVLGLFSSYAAPFAAVVLVVAVAALAPRAARWLLGFGATLGVFLAGWVVPRLVAEHPAFGWTRGASLPYVAAALSGLVLFALFVAFRLVVFERPARPT
ncbi:hypothetical protein ACFQPA_04045 [Halomarina halobia]|uniref:Uncharacterized protein n=1 Tax=Halomarina halobia TaxID=3033386 RepID=A0ABD6A5V4_9EURY|nr:hypothetical protein [Halomarina sp. PSR21]